MIHINNYNYKSNCMIKQFNIINQGSILILEMSSLAGHSWWKHHCKWCILLPIPKPLYSITQIVIRTQPIKFDSQMRWEERRKIANKAYFLLNPSSQMILPYRENSLKIWRTESERREECLDERMDATLPQPWPPFIGKIFPLLVPKINENN